MADGAAADVDLGIAMTSAWLHLAIILMCARHQIETHRAIVAAAEDGAEYGTILDFDEGVAADAACGQGFGVSATTGTEHVAVVMRIAIGTNGGFTALHHDMGVVHHVTFLTTTQHTAVDGAARDFDIGVVHVRPRIEIESTIALAATIHIAIVGLVVNLRLRTMPTQLAASHDDRGLAAGNPLGGTMLRIIIGAHVGGLTAAIEVAVDRAARHL